jgi:uncharacterized protein (UPF0210 family)
MKIRSITYFFSPSWPINERAFEKAGGFISAAQTRFESAGYEVETVRLASVPFSRLLGSLDAKIAITFLQQVEFLAQSQGFSYVSAGPALPEFSRSFSLIPEAMAATENVFFSGMMTLPDGGVSLPAVRACAEVIQEVAPLTPDGFANLRFAALANVPPGSPFFPAAFAGENSPSFALATEAADLAVEAFSQANSLEEARRNLQTTLESHAGALNKAARFLSEEFRTPFGGIDFSLAPFPEEALSLGTALERLGVPAVGLHGSLAAAAILADTLDRAHFQHTGFSGLMLPVLEDASLARRAAEGILSVKDLLLFSAVCGTGLDTIPLPGDTQAEALAAILLDLAALAQRLDKPLTARLMPIPGKSAGDPTQFDFPYFANSRVMAIQSAPLGGLLAGEGIFDLRPRRK